MCVYIYIYVERESERERDRAHYMNMSIPAKDIDSWASFAVKPQNERPLAPIFRRAHANAMIMSIESLNNDGIHYKAYPEH